MNNINKLSAVLAAAAVTMLAAGHYFMLLRVSGGSMYPTLKDGDILLCRKGSLPVRGEISAFRYGGRLLVKRIAAFSGEPTAIGIVPDGCYYVTGDNRAVSIDSGSGIGFVSEKDIAGKALFIAFPLNRLTIL